ncbi:spore germination protein [Bacillaceae bacterium S4-13-56]
MQRSADKEKKLFHSRIEELKDNFKFPTNTDFMVRELYISAIKKDAIVLYLDSMVNADKIEKAIIGPLLKTKQDSETELDKFIKNTLPMEKIKVYKDLKEINGELINGNTILIVEGIQEVFSLGTTSFAHRPVSISQNESVVKGPKESFTESGQENRSLIRKKVRNHNLIMETMEVGKRSINTVSVVYLDDLANEKLVKSVKARIQHINADMVSTIEELEQYIEERSFSLIPTVLYTERPDRAAHFIEEGYVVVVMDNSPACLICPATFWSFFQNPEDYYLRLPYGNFSRLVRFFAFFVGLFTPAIYISVTTFHTEMLPPDLLLAIAGSRELVPFPVIMEIIMMEIAFEILREAGIRIPNPIGPTIGIVGALILGQAAVEANIISPIIVIVIAITGLSSFALGDVSFNYMLRMARFIFTISGAVMGFFGMISSVIIAIAYMASMKSFGVPYISPIAPFYKSSKDTLYRLPIWMERLRPAFVKPKDVRRKP